MMLPDFWGQCRKDHAGSALFTRMLAQKPWASMGEAHPPWGSQMTAAHRAQATPAETPDTREPGHSVPSCICLDSWPTGPANRKRDCYMQLSFRKVWHVTKTTSNSNTSSFFLDFTLFMFLNHFFNIEKTGCHYSQNVHTFAQSLASCKQSPHRPGFIFTCPHLLPWPLGILVHFPHRTHTHTHSHSHEHFWSAVLCGCCHNPISPQLYFLNCRACICFCEEGRREDGKEEGRRKSHSVVILILSLL